MKSIFSLVLFLSFLPLSYFLPQQGIKVLSSNDNSITIEYTPDYSETTFVSFNNNNYYKVLVNSSSSNPIPGFPNLPNVIVNVGVPSEFGNTFEIINSEFKVVQAKPLPYPLIEKEGDLQKTSYIEDELGYNNVKNELISFDEFGLIRDLQVQSFVINPVHYSAANNELKLYTKVIFKINFSSNRKFASLINDNLIKNVIVNYPIAKKWGIPKKLNKLTSSVLAIGTWYKFEAPVEGIYKITKSMFPSLGIDANVDPRTIKIYNNGGKELPENPDVNVSNDLIENAIYISGEGDGVFNDEDYILFYGRGINFYEKDSISKNLVRFFNKYSKENWYFITSGGNIGKRMKIIEPIEEVTSLIETKSKDLVFFEEDKYNLASSSKYFFGDEFSSSTRSRTYMNRLEGKVPGTQLLYNFRVANTDQQRISFNVDDNSQNIFSGIVPGISDVFAYSTYSSGNSLDATAISNNELPDNRSVLKFNFNTTSAAGKTYLDYFEIRYNKFLTAVNNSLLFFSNDSNSLVQYDLNGFTNSNIRVFDISDFSNVNIILPNSLSGGDFKFKNRNPLGKFIAIGNDNFLSPSNIVNVKNQDIHSIAEGVKNIIITSQVFNEQALRLKNYRESHPINPLTTIVVNVEELYNEFSGGNLDPTAIRNYLKYAYENMLNKPDYVLLFGDGTYDYKNIEKANNNFVPAFETYTGTFSNVLHHIYSYPMDDYYARVSGSDKKIDLALGRLTVNSIQDAKNIVDKIIYYESSSGMGSWRNNITLVADDGRSGVSYDGSLFTSGSEKVANITPKSFNINKIYMAKYPSEVTGTGIRKPAVTLDLINALNEGTLIWNFIGHGSPEVLTHERIFELNTFVPQLHNDKYFFMVAGTCDFGYYDHPSKQSAAELILTKESSGAIGLITAARPVFAQQNEDLVIEIFSDLLNTPQDSLYRSVSIGKAFFITKQLKFGENDEKYILLGDPALTLNSPRYQVIIDSINGLPASQNIQVKALSTVSISGTINNSQISNYSGEGILTVYDSDRIVNLPEINNYGIREDGGLIFNGRVSINQNRFNTSFVVPKDISYENKPGKIVFYFNDNNIDGIGYNNKIIVGGSDSSVINDGKGPEIKIYFDAESYVNSKLINPNSKLIVELKDETGLNTTGAGVGHKLEGILNKNENAPLDFSKFFVGDVDANGRSGKILYPFTDLEQGSYTLDVKVWDIFNNFATQSITFEVVNNNELVINDVYNYPNPFSSSTSFTFQQNVKNPVNIVVRIYTIAGRAIKEIEQVNSSNGFVKIDWDGRDQDGDLVANGVYLYKVIVMSTDGSVSKSVNGKLAIVR